ncbi:MAG: hypothetical protein ACKPKO_31180, partial [Candidatus Fonsibacter sp.]
MIMSYLRLKPSPLKTSSFLVKMFMRLSSWTIRRGGVPNGRVVVGVEVVLEIQFPKVTHYVPCKGLAVGDEQNPLGIASLDETLEECRLTRAVRLLTMSDFLSGLSMTSLVR